MRQAVLAMLLFAVTFGVAGAQADEKPNTVYLGTHAGGGTVEFHVNAAGTAVDYLEIALPGTCGRDQMWPQIPIVNHAFAREDPTSFFRGTFGTDETASGTLRLANTAACDTGIVTWTARAIFPPPPIPPRLHPPYCHVSNVVGKTLAAAKRKLASARCTRVRVTRAHSRKAKKGRVLSQRPRAGTWLPGFGWVFLVVGRGPRR